MSDFEETPDWRPSYAHGISSLLPDIRRFFAVIKEFVQDPNNAEDVQEFKEEHRHRFITEYNRKNEVVRIEDLPQEARRRLEIKRKNMADAVEHLFGDSLCANSLKVDFNSDLPKELHRIIGKDLVLDAGVFREHMAIPHGYDFTYLDAGEIEVSLNSLFATVTEPIRPGRDDWYTLATDFFNRFLFAHPFKNGNGRVARCLLSALLINYSIVPVCLFSWKKSSNDIYLDVLEETHHYKNDKRLKSYIIESVHGTLKYCAESFDLL